MEKKKMKTNYFRNIFGNNDGFTIIEVIIVITILGALAALAIPRFSDVLKNSSETTDKANIAIVETALETYYAEKGTWPVATTFDNLVTELSTAGYLKNTSIEPNSDGKVFDYNATTHTISLKTS